VTEPVAAPNLDVVLLLRLHLPAGGTLEANERAWRQCFEPLIGAIHHTPDVRLGLVLSGELIADLEERHPEGLEWIRGLIDRGQVEIVATGLYEPVLSSIPERDAAGQIEAHVASLRKALGAKVAGGWLPHGVWDPSVPRIASNAGLSFMALPDRLLEAVGVPRGDAFGIYRTEREGHGLSLLPIDSRVGEVAAEVPVKRVLAHLRGRRGKGHELVTLMLRGERFGLHPGSSPQQDQTWLATLLAALARAPGIRTVLPSDAIATGPRSGLVYLPSGAPPPIVVPWEHHLVRYDAAGRLHKRAQRVSKLVDRLARRLTEDRSDRPDPAIVLQARRYLYRAQSSEPYWHHEHAGVHDPALRALAWKDLLRAEETALDGLGVDVRALVERVDVDGDGVDEVVLRTPELTVVVAPARSGAVVELSDHRAWRNWADTTTRVAEPYHDQLPTLIGEGPASAEADTAGGQPLGDADRAVLKSFASMIAVDPTPRATFSTSFLSDADTVRAARDGLHRELAPTLWSRPWSVVSADRSGDDTLRALLTSDGDLDDEGVPRAIRVAKRYTLRRDLLAYRHEVENRSGAAIRPRLLVACDVAVGGPEAYVEVDGERVPSESTRDCGRVETVRVVDGEDAVEVRLLQPAHLWVYPIVTVHRHLGAWARTLHAVTLAWVLRTPLKDGERARFDLKLRSQCARPSGAPRNR
jgi:hypothetical protein